MRWMDFAELHPEVSTAYTAYILGLMIEIAQTLGRTEDIPRYREYRDGCRRAYQAMAKTEEFTLCGIRVEGENRFTITPHPGGHFTQAKAAYNSVYGRVESGWEKTKSGWSIP